MATSRSTLTLPLYPDRDHKVREACMAIAVDVSASTQGPGLAAEKKFISRITKHLSPRSQISSTILPWSTSACDCIGLNDVNTLMPQSSTRPVVILQNAQHLAALRRSSVWFLLTDGEVPDDERVSFATKIPMTGLHGVSCIAAIVQSREQFRRPGLCNISVGVSVYALSPNCLFVFYDTSSNHIFILQAKGAFRSLLKGAENPILNENTTWQSLPRLSLDDLADVVIPVPKYLDNQQIALQDSLVINVDDLAQNRLVPEAVDQILTNEDNLSSIIMTLQSRNQGHIFQDFIRQQEITVDDPMYQQRDDLEGRASAIYVELLQSMDKGKSQHHLQGLRESLRESHSRNMRAYVLRAQDGKLLSERRHATIRMASARTEMSHIDESNSLSATASYNPDDDHDYDHDFEVAGHGNYIVPNGEQYFHFRGINHLDIPSTQSAPERAAPAGRLVPEAVPRYYTQFTETWKSWVHEVTNPELLSLLYTPGFRCKTGSFKGMCPICNGKGRTLAWLFRRSKASELGPTADFPAPGSLSALAFPLAMGFFVETDIVSSAICCESCSVCVTASKRAPDEASPVVAALPMIRYAENAESYRKLLHEQFLGRFAEADVVQVFMSALYNAAAHLDDPKTSELFRSAFQWTYEDLMTASNAPTQLSGIFSQGNSLEITLPMRDALPELFSPSNISPFLMQYPLHGFMVLLQTARSNRIPLADRQLAVLRRFLYTLAEEIFSADRDNKTVESLEGPLTENTLLSQLGPLLWNYEWMTQTTMRKTPKISIPPATVRGMLPLESTSRLFDSIDDAKFLDDAGQGWVGTATAVFLHALNQNITQGNSYANAWEAFNAILCVEQMGPVFLAPQGMNADQARQIIARFQ